MTVSVPTGPQIIRMAAMKDRLAILRPFGFLATMRERRRIRRVCVDTLALYRRIMAQRPQDSSRDLYAHIVSALCGKVDLRAALDVVRRSEESFAMWPVERPPCLRDIAQYMALTDRLAIDPAVTTVSSRIVELILVIAAEVIPEDL